MRIRVKCNQRGSDSEGTDHITIPRSQDVYIFIKLVYPWFFRKLKVINSVRLQGVEPQQKHQQHKQEKDKQ